MYTYHATLIRVVDGDTVWLDIDLGLRVHVQADVRLLGINAPEMIGHTHDAGQVAKDHLAVLLAAGTLTIETEKPLANDKYGRWLARLTVSLPDGTTFVVNDRMLADGFAAAYP